MNKFVSCLQLTNLFAMRNKLCLLPILLLLPFFAFAQTQKNTEESFLEYFKLPRESIFLHTNKTTYLTGEDIWFKAYTYDRKNNLSSKKTTNIYVGLYDEKGVEITKKLYLAQNGIAEGSMPIGTKFTSGEYFLKVSTNWMKNFKEDDSFLQKVNIINPEVKKTVAKKVNETEYDFQLLPEGGHLLQNVKNTIGVKAISDTGFGTKASGTIHDSKGVEITSFQTNFLGIGRFYIKPQEGETYTAKVTLENGKEFKQNLPPSEKTGVSIQLNNMRPNKTFISLVTNEVSLDLFKNDTLKLHIHNGGDIKTIPVIFKDISVTIALQKKDLFPGVNIVTLFNKNNIPILERMFFNEHAIKDTKFEVSNLEIEKDSVQFSLKNLIPTSDQDTIFASVSILPTGTKSYNPSHNIISALFLKSSLKGSVEKLTYYFTKLNRKKMFELDALLITQGWSRYSWDDIFNSPPKPNFDFENGFTLNGFFNTPLNKANSLFLYPTLENKSSFVKYDQEGKFHLQNFYPFVGEKIKFSYMDSKGSMKRPAMTLNFIKHADNSSINLANIQYDENASFYSNKNDLLESFQITSEYEKLDEIKLKAKVKPKEKDPILINAKVTIIGKDEVESFPRITDFIQHSGYDVFIDPITHKVSINSRRRSRAYIDVAGTLAGTATDFTAQDNNLPLPVLFIDGVRTPDFSVLLNIQTESIEKIVVDRAGLGMGMSAGFGGVIKIFTRKNVFIPKNNKKSPNAMTYIADYGFEPVKKFYVPKYTIKSSEAYKNYGAIHWEPNLIFIQNSSYQVKMKEPQIKEFNLYIEGISSDGTVFSQLIKVNN